jgi:hypothetical protein
MSENMQLTCCDGVTTRQMIPQGVPDLNAKFIAIKDRHLKENVFLDCRARRGKA